jgi:hypothetical protein
MLQQALRARAWPMAQRNAHGTLRKKWMHGGGCVRSTSSLSRSYTCNPFLLPPPSPQHNVLRSRFVHSIRSRVQLPGLRKHDAPMHWLPMPVTAPVQGRHLLPVEQRVAAEHPRGLRARAVHRRRGLLRDVPPRHHRDHMGSRVPKGHVDAQRARQPLHQAARVLSRRLLCLPGGARGRHWRHHHQQTVEFHHQRRQLH